MTYYLFPNNQAWNLDSESSHATAFSGWLLFSIAWVCTIIYFRERHQQINGARLWLTLVVLFFYLAFDEVFSFHEWLPQPQVFENISSQSTFFDRLDWLRIYLPLFLLVGSFIIYFMLKKMLVFKSALFMMMAGGMLYALAIGAEMVMQQFELRGSNYHLLQVAVEESLEMLGSIFFLQSLLLYLKNQLQEVVDHEKNYSHYHYF